MFSTRFFNNGLMVIFHKTKQPLLHRVEMATIVTYIQGESDTQYTTGLSFDLQPDIWDPQKAGKHEIDPRLVFIDQLSGLVYFTFD